jgi:Mn-containing catalase
MYHHVKKLMFTVRVDEPDPRFGNMLLEQFGGANGELAAAMQYSIQGLNCEDPDREGLLMDIGRGTEPCRSEVNPCPRLIL